MAQKKTVDVSENNKPQARQYSGQQSLNHDLFKLKSAEMVKNTSWEGQKPNFVKIEHCHIFHTIDSSGRKMDTCSAVGGHFHIMTVSYQNDGVPAVKCSPAMKYVRANVNGRYTKVAAEMPEDQHTHDIEYMGSQVITPRTINAEGARALAALEAPYKKSVSELERDFAQARNPE